MKTAPLKYPCTYVYYIESTKGNTILFHYYCLRRGLWLIVQQFISKYNFTAVRIDQQPLVTSSARELNALTDHGTDFDQIRRVGTFRNSQKSRTW